MHHSSANDWTMHNFHRSLPGSIGLSKLTVFNTRKVFDPGEVQKKTFPEAMSTLQEMLKKSLNFKVSHPWSHPSGESHNSLLMFHVCRFGTQHFPVSTPSSIHNVKTTEDEAPILEASTLGSSHFNGPVAKMRRTSFTGRTYSWESVVKESGAVPLY